jgi:hypothetical protein
MTPRERPGIDLSAAAVTAAVFLLLGVVRMLAHEPWRDELEAWALARDARSLEELIGNSRYTGHPFAWWVLLFALSRWSRNPLAMQAAHLAVATLVIFLLVGWAPFSRRVRLLLAFGYFPFFEYAVISRMYAPGVLLIFLACVAATRRRRSHLLLGALVGLLAGTNAFAGLIGLALAGAVALDEWRRPPGERSPGGWRLGGGLALLGAGLAAAVLTTWPPADAGVATAWHTELDGERLLRTLGRAAHGYLPVPAQGLSFWNSHFLRDWPTVRAAVGVLIMAFVAEALRRRRHPPALFLWAAATAGILTFVYVKYGPHMRHAGHLPLALVAAAWLAARRPVPGSGPDRASHASRSGWGCLEAAVVGAGLGVHLLVGLHAAQADLRYPFSGSREAARVLRERGLDGTVLVGDVDYTAAAVGALLDRPVWYPGWGRFATFVRWETARLPSPTEEELIQRTLALRDWMGRTVLLIRDKPLDAVPPRFRLVAAVDRSIDWAERYWLYLVEGPDP